MAYLDASADRQLGGRLCSEQRRLAEARGRREALHQRSGCECTATVSGRLLTDTCSALPRSAKLLDDGGYYIRSQYASYSAVEEDLGAGQHANHPAADSLRIHHRFEQEFQQLPVNLGENHPAMCTFHW